MLSMAQKLNNGDLYRRAPVVWQMRSIQSFRSRSFNFSLSSVSLIACSSSSVGLVLVRWTICYISYHTANCSSIASMMSSGLCMLSPSSVSALKWYSLGATTRLKYDTNRYAVPKYVSRLLDPLYGSNGLVLPCRSTCDD
jgi:hypothetical protein